MLFGLDLTHPGLSHITQGNTCILQNEDLLQYAVIQHLPFSVYAIRK